MRRWAGTLLLVATGLCTATAVWGGTEKLAADLQGADLPETVDVIVQYKNAPDTTKRNTMRERGGVVRHSFATLNAEHYRVPAAALKDLSEDPDVLYVSPDRPVTAFLDQAAAAINAQAAYQFSLNGNGVGIAVIDSGIGLNTDLNGAVVYSQSFNGDTNDHFGHGTHVAGIIGGSGQNSSGRMYSRTFQGIAQGANLINLKVLDSNGAGSDSTVIAGIEAAISLKSKYNIRVINLSLGRPVFESYKLDPLCQEVEKAWKAGIVVVVAAGNFGRANPTTTHGYGTITAPGNDPYVITVGATNDMMTPSRSDDVVASYSSKGPTLFDNIVKPDLVAPGNLIDSTLAPLSNMTTAYPLTDILLSQYMNFGPSLPSTNYLQLSGTSMATPFVSATAALLLQQNSNQTPDQIKARLMKTAWKGFPSSSSYTDPSTGTVYTEQYDIFTIGAGYLDVDAALTNNTSSPASLSALSPGVTFTTSGNTTTATLVNGANVVWGSNVVWGANVVWGSNVVWGANVVWGSNVVWGASNLLLSGANVVWGANVAAANVVWGAGANSGDAASVTLSGDH